ncbi:hypothetical protein BDP27DRAFT_1335187 [Rhodocollybia butyracea]|uniref:Uncharacterized protein n=1 Tax=Rhodocollybia butyracea TaxID=206335 RepID=A0A9P5U2D1_9AGAR|nr:hypothetical protein BDP27DRAFT_1335187 [Rhodocollybia butyracea]
MSSGASEIYARLLLPRKHGYPLWRPEPNELLPLEYQDEGIRIGDVGVITADGAFDFLFNVFLPKDHVINQWNRAVPEGFTPLPWDSRQVNRSSHLHCPGVSISSSGAQCYDLSIQASA